VATRALDEPRSHELLELSDALTDRRLHVAKPVSRPAKRLRLRYGGESR
jgi:hypothetical protein